MAVPPWEEGQSIGDMGSDVVVFPELGIAPLIDSGTDLEDELPTPDDSPASVAVHPAEAALPEVCPVPKGRIDLELAKALLDVSVLPMMVTPIVDPVVDSVVSPTVYPEPPLPVLLEDEQVPVLESSPLREVAGRPVRECSPSFQASPVGSGYGQIPSSISLSLRIADVPGLLPCMATMDQYLPRISAPFAGGGLSSSAYASDPSSDCRGDSGRVDRGFPDRGACCCVSTGLV